MCSKHILIFPLLSMAVEFGFNSSTLSTTGCLSGNGFVYLFTQSLRKSPASSGAELPGRWQRVDDESLREGSPLKPRSLSSQKTATLWQLFQSIPAPDATCFMFMLLDLLIIPEWIKSEGITDCWIYPSYCTFVIWNTRFRPSTRWRVSWLIWSAIKIKLQVWVIAGSSLIQYNTQYTLKYK